MPPTGSDVIRAIVTHALNATRTGYDRTQAADLGTHIEVGMNGNTYKITVERVN